jgi:hypothetical protein
MYQKKNTSHTHDMREISGLMKQSTMYIALVLFTVSLCTITACTDESESSEMFDTVSNSGTQAGLDRIELAGTQAGTQAGTAGTQIAGTQVIEANFTTQIQNCKRQCAQLVRCDNLLALCGEEIANGALIGCQQRCEQVSWRDQLISTEDLCQDQASVLISALDLADACLAQSSSCTTDDECSNTMTDHCEGDELIMNIDRCQNQRCTVVQESYSCIAEGLVCRAAQCVQEENIGIQEGDLVITEIMYNPDSLEDDVAEWFEIYNVSSRNLDLSMCTVQDGSLDNTTALTELQIQPLSFILIGVNEDPMVNGGLTLDAVVDFKLANDQDSLSIICNGQVIDTITYDDGGDFPKAKGSSLSLSADAFDASANDQGSSWCLAQQWYWGDLNMGNAGTPGRANPICSAQNICSPNPCIVPPLAACEGNILVTYQDVGSCIEIQGEALCDYDTTRQDCATQGLVCLEGACVNAPIEPPIVGDVVITEIMYNPTHGNDNIAEYLEIYNRSNRILDLSSCLIKDNGNSGNTLGEIQLPAQSYMLIGRSDDAAQFGGVAPQATFSFGLNNGADQIQILCNDQIIDQVSYDEAQGFAVATGSSLQLDLNLLNTQSNDIASAWCLSQEVYVADNLGTPGRANTSCQMVSNLCESSVTQVINQAGSWQGDLSQASDLFQPGCSDNDTQGLDLHYQVIVDQDTTVCANTFGSVILSNDLTDTILYVRTQCEDVNTELACQDDQDISTLDSQIQWEASANVPYDLIVDSYSSFFSSTFQLNVNFGPCQ